MVPFVENIELMSKSKAYKKQEPIERTVNEPIMEYRSLSTIEETELLSNEIIIRAVKYAQIAREKGRMVPNNEVYGLLADRLGMDGRIPVVYKIFLLIFLLNSKLKILTIKKR